ncbi:MAG TPA: universal stress protein [Longimicrobiales bacterium]
MPELTAVPSAPPSVHRVLVVGGGAPAVRLLELARCSTPRNASFELVTINAASAEVGGPELLLQADPQAPIPAVRAVLRALHETKPDALVVGYPDDARGRSAFTDVVERATAAAPVDVIVCIDRHDRPWRRVLVPYLHDVLDSRALGLARRIARTGDADVTVLHVVEPLSGDEVDEQLRAAVGRCALKVVTADDPIAAAAAEARLGYDLIVLGASERRTRGRYFTMRQQRLLLATDATLVIVHPGRQAG